MNNLDKLTTVALRQIELTERKTALLAELDRIEAEILDTMDEITKLSRDALREIKEVG